MKKNKNSHHKLPKEDTNLKRVISFYGMTGTRNQNSKKKI